MESNCCLELGKEESNSKDASIEKPLSPVLNKKRFNRKPPFGVQCTRKNISKDIEDATKSEPIGKSAPHKIQGSLKVSAIPVPLKEGCEFKQPLTSKKAVFKPNKEGINALIDRVDVGFCTASGKSISISESKIKKCADIFANIFYDNAHKDLKVYNDNKSKYSICVPKRIDFKCASGDISNNSSDLEFRRKVNERSQYINRETRDSSLSMLYENKQFEMSLASKTTMTESVCDVISRGSADDKNKIPINVYCNNNYHSTDSSCLSIEKTFISNDKNLGFTNAELIMAAETVQDNIENDIFNNDFKSNKSQLNYNYTTDCSSSTENELEKIFDRKLEQQQSKEHYKLCTQETNLYFANLSQNMNESVTQKCDIDKNEYINNRVSSKNTVNVNYTSSIISNINESYKHNIKEDKFPIDCSKFSSSREIFFGFSSSEIRKIENDYHNYKNHIAELSEQISNSSNNKKYKYKKKDEQKNAFKSAFDEIHDIPDITFPYSKRPKHNSKIMQENSFVLNKIQEIDSEDNQNSNSQDKSKSKKKPSKNNSLSHEIVPLQRHQTKAEESNETLLEPNKKNFKIPKKNVSNNNSLKSKSQSTEHVKNSISLASHNRLQILIGSNNRIKINIKSDNGNDNNSNLHQIVSKSFSKDKSTESMDFKLEIDEQKDHNDGFKTASNKLINIPQKLYDDAKHIYDATENDFDLQSRLATASDGFKSAAGKPIKISDKILKDAEKRFNEDNTIVCNSENMKLQCDDFKSTSGDAKKISEIKPEGTSEMENIFTFGLNRNTGFSSASGIPLEISDKSLKDAEKLFQDAINTNNLNKRKMLKPKSLLKARPECGRPTSIQNTRKSLFNDKTLHSDNTINSNEMSAFSCASEKESIKSSEQLESISNDIDVNISSSINTNNLNIDNSESTSDQNKTAHELIEDVVSAYDTALEKCFYKTPRKLHQPFKQSSLQKTFDKNVPNRPIISKRRLGVSRCKQIVIPKEKFEKAKQIFEDINVDITPTKKMTSSEIKFEKAINTSTPISKQYPKINLNYTPIKYDLHHNLNSESSLKILFHEQSCMDFKQLQNDIDKEYFALKSKLNILEERRNAVDSQKKLIESREGLHRRQRLGILSMRKESYTERVPLKKLFNFADANVDYFNISQQIFDVTPRNAEQVHFNIANIHNDKYLINTLDGAIIIPNLSNTIGLTEINNAFQAMAGVDPTLLPKNWIKNHYKWIVWKLASYERKFPQYFKECLSFENIVQQLKYRYDREIDKVQRSALRRILEKDDVPQKRLVLCVADIVSINTNKFELELTDGWYSVLTIIDMPLSQQIYKNKIKIGTKLLIQGAEILNCDGCHPLEIPSNVRLRIGYNATRRAAWHLKLGYYKIPIPYIIPIKSLNPEGGPISVLQIFIARVYPLRYMENHNNSRIWRNARAEEKCARNFEAEKAKQLEDLKYKLMQEYGNEKNEIPTKVHMKSVNGIGSITSPNRLYNIIQTCDDPESIINSLTLSQQKSIIDHKQDLMRQKDKDISYQLTKQVEELRMNKRDVVPMLKLLVLDAYQKSDKYFVFNLWKPCEEHLLLLKEESTFNVYNVTMKKTGELSSTAKTYLSHIKSVINNKTHRQLLPIAMTVDNYYKPLFNEFDTVGLVVLFKIHNYNQELWLSDFVGRLLYVKIVDGPKLCSLLDNVKRGQTVALSNLILHTSKNEVGHAIGNQFTIISQYPQQKFLQHGLDIFNKQLPQDTTKLLNQCDNKITHLQDKMDYPHRTEKSYVVKLPNCNEDEDNSEDNSTIPSRLTMTDVAMSLIDTDQFV